MKSLVYGFVADHSGNRVVSPTSFIDEQSDPTNMVDVTVGANSPDTGLVERGPSSVPVSMNLEERSKSSFS